MINMFYYHAGVYWPVQSFPEWGRIASHLGPVTFPAEGVRAIIGKGIVLYVECVSILYTSNDSKTFKSTAL